MKNPSIRIQIVISQLFAENAYIAYLEGRRDCLVFDPGSDHEKIISCIEQIERTPAAVINTHGHADHILGNEALLDRWPDAPLIIGAKDADKLTDPDKNLSSGHGLPVVSPQATRLVREGDVVDLAGIRLDVLETPGHSVGHVVFAWREGTPAVLFAGDVLFQGSIGRTDFPDGSLEQLVDSIHHKLFTMPEDTIVLPGHGQPTTIGDEQRHNPFVGRPAGWAG